MPVNIGPKISIEGEAQYRAQINNIITQTKTLHAEMRAMESSWTKETSARQKAAEKSKLLTSAIQRQKELVAQNTRMLAESTAKYGENDARTQRWRQAVANATTELNKLKAELAALPNRIQALGQDMQAAGDKIASAGKKISGVGSTMTKSITLPIAAIGVASVKMASDFETSMAKVSTIADSSVVSYDEMREAIIKLSDETGVAATDIAENVYQAISAGQDTANAVQFVEKTTKLAKSGFTETGQALDVLTTILNAYGLKSSEVNKVSDILIQTQNQGKTTVGQLAESMGKVIPTAAAYGVGLEQLSAAYATLTKNGMNTAISTTAINGLLNELGKTGSKASKVLQEKTGKSFKELMESGWSLSDALAVVESAAKESGVEIGDMFSNDRARKGALSLTQNADDFTDALGAMAKATGTTDKAFRQVTDTTAAKFKKALNEAKNTGIDLGQAILTTAAPALKDISETIKRGLTWFRNLDDSQKKAIIKFAGIAAAIGPVLTIGGKLVTLVGNTVKGVGKMVEGIGGLIGRITATTAATMAETSAEVANTAAKGTQTAATVAATTAQEGLNAAMLANPVGLLVAGIAGLTVGMIAMAKSFKRGHEEAWATADAMKDAAKQARDMRESIGSTAGETETEARRVKELGERLKELNSKTTLTADEQKELQRVTAQLNRAIPDLGLEIDKNSGKLKGNTKEINANIEAWVKNYEAQAKQKQLEILIDQLAEANNGLLKAEQEVAKYSDKVVTPEQLSVSDAMTASVQGRRVAIDEETKAYAANSSALRTAQEAEKEYSLTVDELNQQIDAVIGSIDAESVAMSESVDDNEAAALAIGEVGDAAGEMADDTGLATDEVAAAMQKMTESLSSSISSAMGMFDAFEQGEAMSTETILANLDSQIEGVTQWEANIARLAELGGEDAKALVQAMIDAGPESAAAVQAMVDGGAEAIAEIATKWNTKEEIINLQNEQGQNLLALAGASVSAINTGTDQISAAATEQGAAIGASIAEGENSTKGDVTTATEGLISATDTTQYSADVSAQAGEMGRAIPKGVAEGISASGKVVDSAIQTVLFGIKKSNYKARAEGRNLAKSIGNGLTEGGSGVRAATTQIANVIKQGLTQISASKATARTAGLQITQGIGAGMQSGTGQISAAASSINTAVNNVLNAVKNRRALAQSSGTALATAIGTGIRNGANSAAAAASAAGAKIGANFSGGLSGRSGAARAAGSSVANAGKAPLESMGYQGFSWGQHLGQNFADGIGSKRWAAENEARKTAQSVANILKHTTPKEGPLKNDDVWGEHLAMNFANGIREATPAVRAAAVQMADAAKIAAYDPAVVSGRGAMGAAITESIDLSAAGLDAEAVYAAIRAGVSNFTLQIGERELGRVLRDMGVAFVA